MANKNVKDREKKISSAVADSTFGSSEPAEEVADLVFQAVNYDNVELLQELLVENPALVNCKDENGLAPLHYASINGHTGCVEILLRFGADVDAVAGLKRSLKTPLLLASEAGQTAALQCLVSAGADLFYCDIDGHSALQLAQINGHQSTLDTLISIIESIHADAVEKHERLRSASAEGDVSAVLAVLSDLPAGVLRRQILNGTNPDEKPAIFVASENGRGEALRALLTVSGHSSIHQPSGDSLLHAAIASQSPATVGIILEKFPHLIAEENKEHSLPIHWAARCGNLDVLRLLLEWNYADTDTEQEAQSADQQIPHHSTDFSITKFFFAPPNFGDFGGGVAPNTNTREGYYCFPCDLNARDAEGRTMFYLAVANGHTSLVEYLVEFRSQAFSKCGKAVLDGDEFCNLAPISLDSYAKNGRTPLMTASASGFTDIVKILLSTGRVDPNAPPLPQSSNCASDYRCSQEATFSGALFEAVKGRHMEIVRLLLDFGANDHNNRILSMAIQLDEGGIIGALLSRLASIDTQNRVSKLVAQQLSGQHISSSMANPLEQLLSSAPLMNRLLSGATGHSHPLTSEQPLNAVKLEWSGPGVVSELHINWFLEAVKRLNPRLSLSKTLSSNRLLALSCITRIELSENKLSALPPYLFTQFCSLKTLNCSQNHIAAIELPVGVSVWQSPSLESLQLDHNRLSELPSRLFSGAHFPALKSLSVSHNQLTQLPACVWTAPALLELDVSNNEISTLKTTDFSSPKRNRAAGGAIAGRISRARARRRDRDELMGGGGANTSSGTELNECPQKTAGIEQLPPTHHHPPSRQTRRAAERTPRQNSREQLFFEKLGTPKTDEQLEEETRRASTGVGSNSSSRDSTSKSVPRRSDFSVSEVDIVRVNLWQQEISISNVEEDNADNLPELQGEKPGCPKKDQMSASDKGEKSVGGMLRHLNLSRNKLESIPSCLACCCPRLLRLDVSGNCISSLGPFEWLPASLRHLNASGNSLTQCFVEASALPSDHLALFSGCETPGKFSTAATRNCPDSGGYAKPSVSLSRNSRSRSKSVARSQRSYSTARVAGQTEPFAEKCPHKSHSRLEALKTLNLSRNRLQTLETLFPAHFSTAFGGDDSGSGKIPIATEVSETVVSEPSPSKELEKEMKLSVLLPALSTLDLSMNRLVSVSPMLKFLENLAVLNLSHNAELEDIPVELSLLEKLWSLDLKGCTSLNDALRGIVETERFRTSEILAHLRSKFENSKPYPKLKLMVLGGPEVGKTTLTQMLKQEGQIAPRSLSAKDKSWSHRTGHSPSRASTTSTSSSSSIAPFLFSSPSSTSSQKSPSIQQNLASSTDTDFGVLDVTECTFQPRRSSKSTPTSTKHGKGAGNSGDNSGGDTFTEGPIAFRIWDFAGIQEKELHALEQCFFTRRCAYLLLWRVTDGELGVQELHGTLVRIQEAAPNAPVLIVGTHLDHIRENPNRFPADYLRALDDQIQRRFVRIVDADKHGLPRVLGSLYISCSSKEDVRSLTALIFQCAGEIKGTAGGKRLLQETVPCSFIALERIVVSMADEWRAKHAFPVFQIDDLWANFNSRLQQQTQKQQQCMMKKDPGRPKGRQSTASSVVVESLPAQFRNITEFKKACRFLHENGIICYFDQRHPRLREAVVLDPPWLCALLRQTLAHLLRKLSSVVSSTTNFASSSSSHQQQQQSTTYERSIVASGDLELALRQTLAGKGFLLGGGTSRDHQQQVLSEVIVIDSLIRDILYAFELVLPLPSAASDRVVVPSPFSSSRFLVPSFLPDEYLLRADYPGAKIRIKPKFCAEKWLIREQRPKNGEGEETAAPNPQALISKSITQGMGDSVLEGESATSDNIPKRKDHDRLTRTLAFGPDYEEEETLENAEGENDSAEIEVVALQNCQEDAYRRLYLMQYIPSSFWSRLAIRILGDERISHAFGRFFVVTRRAISGEASDEELDALSKALTNFSAAPEAETSFIGGGATLETPPDSDDSEKTCAETHKEGRAGGIVEWILWQTGMELRAFGGQQTLFSVKQFLPLASVSDVNYSLCSLQRRSQSTHHFSAFENGQQNHHWFRLPVDTGIGGELSASAAPSLLEILIPTLRVELEGPFPPPPPLSNNEGNLGGKKRLGRWELRTDPKIAATLLSVITGALDDLLEDWFPALGTRFVHLSEGQLLVDRLVPCPECAFELITAEHEKRRLKQDATVVRNFMLTESRNRRSGGAGNSPQKSSPFSANTKRNTEKPPPPPQRESHFAGGGKSTGKSSKNPSKTANSPASTAFPKSKSAMSGLSTAASSGRNTQLQSSKHESDDLPKLHLWSFEECLLAARKALAHSSSEGSDGTRMAQISLLHCPKHPRGGQQQNVSAAKPNRDWKEVKALIGRIAPDLLFGDLDYSDEEDLEGRGFTKSEHMKNVTQNERTKNGEKFRLFSTVGPRPGRLVGRGAFGFVFEAAADQGGRMALKVLEPPGAVTNTPESSGISLVEERASAQAAFQAFAMKWRNDPLENATRAYCSARQEMGILRGLRNNKHPNIVALLGIGPQPPLTLVFELAPKAALDAILAGYRRGGHRLPNSAIQQTALQVSRAIEYLHSSDIVFRDLKSGNVLVWRFPTPPNHLHSSASDIHLKLGDYGISRKLYFPGVCKGYGGTEAFMAPEIHQWCGEQEYTERVDIYSFGMLLYELLTLRQPYEGQDQMKEQILEGLRPHLFDKELLYPTNILDLMVSCWRSPPELRPSAADLVAICSAPELANCVDVCLLGTDGEQQSALFSSSSTLICPIQLIFSSTPEIFGCGDYGLQGQISLLTIGRQLSPGNASSESSKNNRQSHAVVHRLSQQLVQLTFNQFGWMDKRVIDHLKLGTGKKSGSSRPKENHPIKITRMCQVEETLWVGDSSGRVLVYDLHTLRLLAELLVSGEVAKVRSMPPPQTAAADSEGEGIVVVPDPESDAGGGGIVDILPFHERRLVVVSSTHKVLIYRTFSASPSAEPVQQQFLPEDARQQQKPQCQPKILIEIRLPKGDNGRIHSVALLPALEDWQIWTGHDGGRLVAHHINASTERLVFSSSLSHRSFFPAVEQKDEKSADNETATGAVRRILASTATKNLVWTTLENDGHLFMWLNGVPKRVLDCCCCIPRGDESVSPHRSLQDSKENRKKEKKKKSSIGILSERFQPPEMGVVSLTGSKTHSDSTGVIQRSSTALCKNESEKKQRILSSPKSGNDHFVTALALVELHSPTSDCDERRYSGGTDDREQLVVGTNLGYIVIVDAKQMLQLTMFRPYLRAVERLIPCSAEVLFGGSGGGAENYSPSRRVLQNELFSALSSAAQPMMGNSSSSSSLLGLRRNSAGTAAAAAQLDPSSATLAAEGTTAGETRGMSQWLLGSSSPATASSSSSKKRHSVVERSRSSLFPPTAPHHPNQGSVWSGGIRGILQQMGGGGGTKNPPLSSAHSSSREDALRGDDGGPSESASSVEKEDCSPEKGAEGTELKKVAAMAEGYYISVGRGYRSLLERCLPSQAHGASDGDGGDDAAELDVAGIFWRTSSYS